MIREEIPRWVMTAITMALSIVLAAVLIGLIYSIVDVRRGYPVLFALLAILPTIGGEFVFAFTLIKRYDRYHLSGTLPSRFALITAIQFLIWAGVRIARMAFFRTSTFSRPLDDAQLLSLLGPGYIPVTIGLAVASLACVGVAIFFAVKGPQDPYGAAKGASQIG